MLQFRAMLCAALMLVFLAIAAQNIVAMSVGNEATLLFREPAEMWDAANKPKPCCYLDRW